MNRPPAGSLVNAGVGEDRAARRNVPAFPREQEVTNCSATVTLGASDGHGERVENWSAANAYRILRRLAGDSVGGLGMERGVGRHTRIDRIGKGQIV